tara:strand:- start:1176 stop:1874 length:699 start_codon:yes stop_codon:yes gene_type:complete
MKQFFSAINYSLTHSSFLIVLILPLLLLDWILYYILQKLDIPLGSFLDNQVEVTQVIESSGLSLPILVFLIFLIVLNTVIYGSMMLAFAAIEEKTKVHPFVCITRSLKKFLPLLGCFILMSVAFQLGVILFILPGFYLFARLGLYPAYVMFENKNTGESLALSWSATQAHGLKLFFLSLIFYGVSQIASTVLVLGSINMVSLVLLVFIKHFLLLPIFYLFYALYKSMKAGMN